MVEGIEMGDCFALTRRDTTMAEEWGEEGEQKKSESMGSSSFDEESVVFSR